jgi:hypothetical protein
MAPPDPGGEEPRWTKEQIDAFVNAVDRVIRKRRIMLAGYLTALVLLIGGQLAALWIYGSAPRGSFVGWVFLIPFAGVGAVLWVFGRWSRRVP